MIGVYDSEVVVIALAAFEGDITKLFADESATLREVIAVIDRGELQIALIVSAERQLSGTVTDGDVRRGLLRGLGLDARAREVMTRDPITVKPDLSFHDDGWLLHKRLARRIPVIGADHKVVGLALPEDEITPQKVANPVVIMAGGLGSRLGALTQDTPKPLLKVGSKPILETILEGFLAQGFEQFYFSVNYKAQLIEDYFGDGSSWDADIRYLREKDRLGTAGALSLLEPPNVPVFVMNGDLLTKVNFRQMLEFHRTHRQQASVAVRKYSVKVPFGVVELQRSNITHIVEKPEYSYFVNAGIYLLNPECLPLIPYNQPFDMPDLLTSILTQSWNVGSFPVHEYWLDVGRLDDFEAANLAYAEVFG